MRFSASVLVVGWALTTLVASAFAAECADGITIPGCATCAPLTEDQIAERQQKWEERKAEWQAKVAASSPAPGSGWRHNHTHNHTHHNGTWAAKNYTCTACVTAEGQSYQLVRGRCVCSPGYGVVPPPKPADGSKPPRPEFACTACPDGYASGANVTRALWRARNGTSGAAPEAAGSAPGRRLLGAHHGFWHSVCFKCPDGTTSSADRTACT